MPKHHEYHPPSQDLLFARKYEVKMEYKNKTHDAIVDLGLKLSEFLRAQNEKTLRLMTDEIYRKKMAEVLHKTTMGVWVFCRILVAQASTISGAWSSLNQIYDKKLDIRPGHELTDIDKLIYLQKFYDAFFNREMKLFFRSEKDISEKNVNAFDVVPLDAPPIELSLFTNELAIKQEIAKLLKSSHFTIKNLANGSPPEENLDRGLSTIDARYIMKKQEQKSYWWNFFGKSTGDHVNRYRLMYAEILRAIPAIVPSDYDIGRSKAMKEGAYICVALAITYESKIFPIGSELYKMCCKDLEVKYLRDIPVTKQLACLSSFKSLIRDNQAKQAWITYLRHNIHSNLIENIDLFFDELEILINAMQEGLRNQAWITYIISKALTAFTGAIGYGAGNYVGFAISQTNLVYPSLLTIAGFIDYFGRLTIGPVGAIFGFSQATLAVQFISGRSGGKIGQTLGEGAGKVIGLSIQKPIELAHTFWLFCLNECKEDVSFDEKRDLLECLLGLPEDVFGESLNQKLNSECQKLLNESNDDIEFADDENFIVVRPRG